MKARVRNAIATLPPREQRVIALYYYREVTMKEIGAELGVNESRVSQLHARAIQRLREALGADATPMAASAALRDAVLAFKPKMAKAAWSGCSGCSGCARCQGAPMPESDRAWRMRRRSAAKLVVVNYDNVSRAARSKSPSLNGLDSQRQPVSSRKRSASVPATSPVTKITRRASAGVATAMAR